MESFLNRYRNITVLLLVIFAQLVLLAVQSEERPERALHPRLDGHRRLARWRA